MGNREFVDREKSIIVHFFLYMSSHSFLLIL